MHRRTGGESLPLIESMLHAKFDWICAKGAGNYIHLRVVSPNHLPHAKAPESARRNMVRVNAIGVDPNVRDAVRPGGSVSRFVHHPRPDLRIGAGVPKD